MADEPVKKKRRWPRRAIIAATALVLLAGLLFIAVQTPPAKRMAARQLSTTLSASLPWPVAVEGFGGLAPFALTVDTISLGPPEDPWFTLRGAAVKLRALPALRGTVAIERVAAEEVTLHRLPPPGEDVPEYNAPLALPELAGLPDWIRVDHLNIVRLALGEAVAGHAVAFEIDGAYLPAEEDGLTLRIVGLDGTESGASLAAGLRDGVVHLKIDANDATLAKAFGGVEGPFALTLSLDGPLSGAAIKLAATRGGGPLIALEGTADYALPLRLSVTGRAHFPEDLTPPALLERLGPDLDLAFALEMDKDKRLRIDNATLGVAGGRIEIAGTFGIADGALDFTPVLHFDDFHRLLGQPREGDAVALVARVPVRGTLSALQLSPEATLDGAAWIAGDVTLALGDTKDARAALRVFPSGGLVPEAYRELLAGGASLVIDASYAADKATIRTARIEAGNTMIDARGTYDIANALLDLDADLTAADLGDFAGIAKQPLAGSLRLEFTARGGPDQTSASGTLSVSDLEAGSVAAPSGQVAIAVTGGGMSPGSSLPDSVTDRLEITVDGAFPGLELQPDLARDMTVKGTAAIDALRAVVVNGFSLADGNLDLRADGTVDLEARAADFTADLNIAQIADYAALTGQAWRGTASVKATARSGDAPGVIQAEIAGTLAGLGGLPETLQAITGDAVTFSGNGRFDGEMASLAAFEWTSESLQASAAGQFKTSDKSLEAEIDGRLTDLDALRGVAKRPMSGAADFHIETSGALDNLSARGSLQGGPFRIDPLRAESAEISFSAVGIPEAIEAELAATLEEAGETLALNTQIGKRGAVLTLGEFNASAGENAISGEGTFDLGSGRGHGAVDVSLPRLAALKTWLDLPLEGSLKFNAALDENSGHLTGAAEGESLVLPGMNLSDLRADFDIADPFAAPSGSLNMEAGDLQAGDWRVTSLTIAADGPADAWNIALKSEGEFKQATRFNVDANGLLSRETGALNLDALQFGAEGHSFSLREPAALSWRDGKATIAALALQGDSGTIEVAGAYAPEAVDLRAALDAVPLRLAELAGIDPPEGTLSGNLTLRGTPAAPVFEAELRVAGYNPEPDGDSDFAGLDAVLKANYAAGALQADASAFVPDALQLEADASLAAAWTLAPWRLEIGRDQPLRGALKGTADLAALPPLLALEGHDMRGDFTADLTLAGTPAAPGMAGSAAITGGYYENGATSTILNDIKATLEARDNALRLTEFSANDGEGGTITGDGQVEFRPGGGAPFHLALSLDQPRLVHRDDLRAQGGGELRVEGDEKSAVITGDLRIGPAYVTLPERTATTRVATVPFSVAGEAAPEDAPEEKGPYAVSLNVRADLPGRVFFRGPGLDSEWEGNLSATGDARNPSVRGTLRVKKGTIDFLGRVFNLAESTISFDGETPPAPYLRITGVTEADDIVARVRMEGLASALNITLESEPSLPRDEILSRVLFGQRLSEVSPVQALTLARYAPIFSKNATAQSVLGSGGPKPFLVDRFAVRGGSGVGEASITTGKYLSDDFYLEFEQGLGSAESLVSLEWLFAPRWSLKGRTTSQGEGGLGVFWKKNY